MEGARYPILNQTKREGPVIPRPRRNREEWPHMTATMQSTVWWHLFSFIQLITYLCHGIAELMQLVLLSCLDTENIYGGDGSFLFNLLLVSIIFF